MLPRWGILYVKAWKQCGLFEKREANSPAWKNANPILAEARAQARVQAYVEYAEKMANGN